MNAFDPASFRQDHLARRARLYGTPAPVVRIPLRDPAEVAAEREALKARREAERARQKAERDAEAQRAFLASLPGPSRARAILLEVANKYAIPPADIIGWRRFDRLIQARFDLYARLRDGMGWSLPQVGRFCGGRDHTTVLHGIRVHLGEITAIKKKRALRNALMVKRRAARQ